VAVADLNCSRKPGTISQVPDNEVVGIGGDNLPRSSPSQLPHTSFYADKRTIHTAKSGFLTAARPLADLGLQQGTCVMGFRFVPDSTSDFLKILPLSLPLDLYIGRNIPFLLNYACAEKTHFLLHRCRVCKGRQLAGTTLTQNYV
jgi:hypothetical protein